MRLLLDTAAFLAIDIKGLTGLGKTSRALVENPDHDLLFSSVSITEIAMKVAIGKLNAASSTINRIAADLQLTIINYEPRHASRLFDLPLYHRDPFDRMLIATALLENCPVVTPDRIFSKYGVQAVW